MDVVDPLRRFSRGDAAQRTTSEDSAARERLAHRVIHVACWRAHDVVECEVLHESAADTLREHRGHDDSRSAATRFHPMSERRCAP